MSLVFVTTFFFFFFFFFWGGGVLRHSAVQTDFEFEISGSLAITRMQFSNVTVLEIHLKHVQCVHENI